MKLDNGKKRIVVKIGTSTITHDTGKANIALIARLARVLSDLKNEGHQLILVSSGAISVGMGRLRLSEKPREIECLQAAAAVGQSELMFLYDRLFSEYDVVVSQLLITFDELENRESGFHLINTLNQLLEYDCLPIVNENDSVSVEELVSGDNDCLSATVAKVTNADLLVILTDTDGLYDGDPSKNKNAKLISRVDKIDDGIRSVTGCAGKRGTGGFVTKINAAEIAVSSGIPVYIVNGSEPANIYKAVNGENIGTYFKAVEKFAPDLMFMPLTHDRDTVTEIMRGRKINYIGVEALFGDLSDEVATAEYIQKMHEKGLLVWANSIVYDENEIISAGFTDDISLELGGDRGWGELAGRGFDFIQTDWLLAAKNALEN